MNVAKKKISGSQDTGGARDETLPISHFLFRIYCFLCFSCCVWLSLVSERIHNCVSEIWAVWDAELVLFYILNKPPSQSLYSSFERERDKLPNQETCHTSPEGSSSLLTRVGCDAHETLNYSLKDHRVRNCQALTTQNLCSIPIPPSCRQNHNHNTINFFKRAWLCWARKLRDGSS